MSDLLFLDDDLTTVISSLLLGAVSPGQSITQKLGLENNTTYQIDQITIAFWPGLKDNSFTNTNGSPVQSARVIRVSPSGIKQVTHMEETSSDGDATLKTNLDAVYLWDGSAAIDETSGTKNLMADTDDYAYFGCELPFPELNFTFSTAGSYGTLTWHYWNGSAWANLSVTDGTNGLTQDGAVAWTIPANWERCSSSAHLIAKTMYWVRVSAASVTTQGVASAVTLGNYIYTLPKSCVYNPDGITVYTKSSDPTPVYTPVAENDYTFYHGIGWIRFGSEQSLSIACDYSCKNPQPATYNLTFPTNTTCSVNSGSAVNIVADGIYKNINVISGLEIVFSSSLQTSDTATIIVSDGLKYLSYAPDNNGIPSTWQTAEYSYGSLSSGNSFIFHIKIEPFNNETSTNNNRYLEAFAFGLK